MYITSDKIHDGHGWLPQGSVIEVSAEGVILSIDSQHRDDAIFYHGILCPGFVNVHCHLELSHMKGVVDERTGLMSFLKQIPTRRNDFTSDQKRSARHAAYDELVRNGIVAAGDIANTMDTSDIRAREELHAHTFVEVIGFNNDSAPAAFSNAHKIYSYFSAQHPEIRTLNQSIIPHAPYSVSTALFKLIDAFDAGSTICIHNQESGEEDRYFKTKEGGVADLLHTFGIDDSGFVPSGKSSIQTYGEYFAPDHPLIFVHNTYTSAEDVRYAMGRFRQTYWCLCPNANMYIEGRLPNVAMLISEGALICIGTDSLASNHQLSILSELETIKRHYPGLDWGILLTWGTLHGAMALQMQQKIGSIEPGKMPGILQITGTEDNNSLTSVKRII